VNKDHSLFTTAFHANRTTMLVPNELTFDSATASRPLPDH